MAGGSAHYYKFTGVAEIQCWTLYGTRLAFPRNETFNDKLRNKVPAPRTHGSGLKEMCLGRALWGCLAGCCSWSQRVTDLLSLWASPQPQLWPCPVSGCPPDPTHRCDLGTHSPQRRPAASIREAGWESKDGCTAGSSPWTSDPAKEGAGKPSSETKRQINPFSFD